MLSAVFVCRARAPAAHAALLYLAAAAFGGCAVYDERKVDVPPPSAAQAATAAVSGSAGPPSSPPPTAASERTDSEPECTPLTAADPCERLPRLPRTPNVDGLLECGLTLTPLTAALQRGAAPAPQRAVQYAAAYSDAGLYLYVAVQGLPITPHAPDQPLFCGDAVELFVDADGALDPQGNYDSTGTMQFVVAAPSAPAADIEAGKFMQGKSFGPWVSSALRAFATPEGYVVEASIGAADLGLWSWQPAGQLGFDLAIDFAAAGEPADPICSTARSQQFLRLAAESPPCAGQPWCDTRAFCVPQLAP